MKKTNVTCIILILVILGITVPAYAGMFSKDETPEEERKQIETERTEILKKMYNEKPELQKKVENAPGYATFSSLNMNLLILATGRGTGVVIDNKKNEKVYMKVTSIGGGIGAGVKDISALIIFNQYSALEQFVNKGWQFGGQADASLKHGDQGGGVGESLSISAPDEKGKVDTAMTGGLGTATETKTELEVYQITEAGISAQATFAGVKFSKDEDLN